MWESECEREWVCVFVCTCLSSRLIYKYLLCLHIWLFFLFFVVIVKFTFYSYSCSSQPRLQRFPRWIFFLRFRLGFFFTLFPHHSVLCLHEFPYCLQSGFKINIFVVYVFTRFLSLFFFFSPLQVSSYIFAHSVCALFLYFNTRLQHSTNKWYTWYKVKIRKRKKNPILHWEILFTEKASEFFENSFFCKRTTFVTKCIKVLSETGRSKKMEFIILFLSIYHGKTLSHSLISGINVSLRLKSSFLLHTKLFFLPPDGIMRLHFIYRKFLLFFFSMKMNDLARDSGER